MNSSEKNKLVSIVILTYNSKECLAQCLKSIVQSAKYPCEVIVVDNFSRSDRRENIIQKVADLKKLSTTHKYIKNVEMISNPQNLYFSKGTNIGMKKAKGDYILILNPDVAFNKEDAWLKKYVKCLEKGKAGIGGALLFQPGTNKFQHAGAKDWGEHIGVNEKDKGQYDKIYEVEWATGASLLIKREVIERIGYLDEVNYPHWESDKFYCIKAREAGFRIICCPVKGEHIWGGCQI